MSLTAQSSSTRDDAPPALTTTSRLAPSLQGDRVRGHALRVSLRFTLLSIIPWAFWQATTGGAAAVKLGGYLGANDFIFSLMGAAPLIGVLFQIPGSMLSDWLGKRKAFFLWTCSIHRMLYVLVGLLPWIFPKGATFAAFLMAFIVTASMALNHFGGQGWFTWMADLVPPKVRGTFFGRRSRLGVASLALSALLMGFILDFSSSERFQQIVTPVARQFGIQDGLIFVISFMFILAGLVGTFDVLAFTKVDEPPMKAVPREPVIERLTKPLYDSAFRRFVIYWSGWTFAVCFNGWVWWVYTLDFLKNEQARPGHAWWADHMYVTATVILMVASLTGSFLSCPIWGRAIDRFGSKPVLFICSTLHTTNWIWWIFLGPVMLPWLALTQFISGFFGGGQELASFNMVLRFNRKGGTAYQSLSAVIFGLAGAMGAIIAGWLATQLQYFTWTVGVGQPWEHTFNRYPVIIATGLLIKYSADLILLPRVIDPGDRPTAHALRYVLDSAYGSLDTLIFTRLKTGVELTGRHFNGVRETLTDTLSDAGSEIRRWWR